MRNIKLELKKAGDFLNSIKVLGIKPGLDNIRYLLDELGSPQDFLKFIHISGTNGKGSTSCFISSILCEAGISNGRFNSPAVFNITEDITINNVPISEKEFMELESVISNAAEIVTRKHGVINTSFEAETAMALYYFAQKKVEVVILECGMGGLLDATNVINTNICSIITSISIEHTAYLGNSIEDIAKMKAGIIKKNSPVFFPIDIKKTAADVICSIAKKNNSYAFFVKPYDKIHFDASYQYSNAGLAVDVAYYLKSIGYNISPKNISDGLMAMKLYGRFEKIYSNPDIIIDGAHNPEAVTALVESLRTNYKNVNFRMIFGAFKDKEILTMLKLIASLCSKLICIQVPGTRGENYKKLYTEALKLGISSMAVERAEDALKYYLKEETDAPIVCFGSLSYLHKIKECVIKND